ncbi:hypothetical protein GGI07_001951 [Coemansia sp. Benny D115]|nr:hypothetical protein GGI07_001951 [Coemansia sp. Benny D115]
MTLCSAAHPLPLHIVRKHIQKVRFTIWIGALVMPEAATTALQNTIKNCGRLNKARCVDLRFGNKEFGRDSDIRDLTSKDAADRIKSAFFEYAKLLGELMPNISQVTIQPESYFDNYTSDGLALAAQISHHWSLFMQNSVNNLSLKTLKTTESLLDGLKGAQLQHISVYCCENSDLYIELVRRNSAWLKRLSITSLPQNKAATIALQPDGSGALVYPCLTDMKLLVSKTGDGAAQEGPENDPFPALAQFTCYSNFPRGLLAILKRGCSHIRRLKIGVDGELMDILEAERVFANGSYTVLDSVYIIESDEEPELDCDQAGVLATMALNMSLNTKHVRLSGIQPSNFAENVLPNVVPSDSLRTIDLGGIELTVDSIVILLSKFKNLAKLNVALKDYPDGGLKAPDNDEIQRWQGELKSCKSNIRTICIEGTSFPNSRRGAECVVLMASILQGVGRIAFKPYKKGNALYNPLKNIQFALKRPIYKKHPYVHSVIFCMEN